MQTSTILMNSNDVLNKTQCTDTIQPYCSLFIVRIPKLHRFSLSICTPFLTVCPVHWEYIFIEILWKDPYPLFTTAQLRKSNLVLG